METLGEYTTAENAQNTKEKKLFRKTMDVNIQFKTRKFSKK
jgi:hypothetical protein